MFLSGRNHCCILYKSFCSFDALKIKKKVCLHTVCKVLLLTEIFPLRRQSSYCGIQVLLIGQSGENTEIESEANVMSLLFTHCRLHKIVLKPTIPQI